LVVDVDKLNINLEPDTCTNVRDKRIFKYTTFIYIKLMWRVLFPHIIMAIDPLYKPYKSYTEKILKCTF